MSNTQEAYIQTLRRIKDAEESAEKEIEARKREVEQEIRNLQIQMVKKIEEAKVEGENLMIKSVEEARQEALVEADSILKDAQIKAKKISSQVNNQTVRRIIDILLKGIE
jgi:vacuolar-type H+-ATPase subunit H